MRGDIGEVLRDLDNDPTGVVEIDFDLRVGSFKRRSVIGHLQIMAGIYNVDLDLDERKRLFGSTYSVHVEGEAKNVRKFIALIAEMIG